MSGVIAALTLLTANFGVIAAVLAFSPTLRPAAAEPPAGDNCFVCSAAEPDTTVSDYPVCRACKTEYLENVQ